VPAAAVLEDDEGEEDRLFCKDDSHRVKRGRRAEMGGRKAWQRERATSTRSRVGSSVVGLIGALYWLMLNRLLCS